MSATTKRRPPPPPGPRADDPRVVRTRAAVLAAARTLVLQQGVSSTTMEQVAFEAGVTKRTLYNNFADKDTLFRQIVADIIGYAEAFARGLHEEFTVGITRTNVAERLKDLGVRLAVGIIRPEIIALRRMLIGEARDYAALGVEYFDRAPAQVMRALADGFASLTRRRILRTRDATLAATQFAYLVVGAHLDRAVMTGELPAMADVERAARDGVVTFLARYGPA